MKASYSILHFCKFFIALTILLGVYAAPVRAFSADNNWQSGHALDTTKALSQFSLDKWSVEDGLPSNAIMAQLKAKNGYIWLATYNGLVRFDGVNFKTYNQKTNPEFPINSLFDMLEDKAGDLWIATNGGGVLKMSGERFSQIPANEFSNNESVTSLTEGQKGTVWVGTRQGLYKIRNSEYVDFPEREQLKHLAVFTLFVDSKGSLWIGTVGEGLWEMRAGVIKKYNTTHGLNHNSVRSIFEDSKGRLWIGTEEGISLMVDDKISEVPVFNTAFSAFVNDIIQDAYGSMWFATNDGLLRYARGTFELLKADQNGEPAELMNLYSDGEGSLWMGSYYRGLMRLRDGKFNNYSSQEGLPNEVINVLWPEQGDVWVGTNAGLAYIREGNVSKVYLLGNNSSANRIRDIYRDSRGTLWVGTNDGIFQLKGEQFEKVFEKGAGLVSDKIRRIVEDKKGLIWIGTRNGLFKTNPAVPDQVSVVAELEGVFILSLFVDAKNRVWVATNGKGLYCMAGNQLLHYTVADGLTSNILFDVWEDKEGNIYACSNDGLSVYRNGRWHQLNEKTGFVTNTVFQVLPDRFDNLWITSSRGIYLIKRTNLLKLIDEPQAQLDRIKHFTAADGMRNSQITALSVSRASDNGQLWFATLGGVSAIHPAQLITNQHAPQVKLVRVVGDKESYMPLEGGELPEVRLAAGVRQFEVKYTAFNYYAPKATMFSYFLEGFDKEWQEVGHRREAYYTNLPAGNYTLKIKAANEDGVWSREESVLAIVQEPYFYESWLFRALFISLVVFGFLLFYLWRTRQLHQKTLTLEHLVEERTNHINNQKEAIAQQKEELASLNHLKDKLLSVLSHDLRQPFSSISGLLSLLRERQIDQQEFNHFSAELSQQVKWQVHMLDNILLWIRNQVKGQEVKPVVLNLHQMVEEVLLLHRSQASFKNIRLQNNVSVGTNIIADADILHLVLRNLIGNAIKFTPETGSIAVAASMSKETYSIEVADTGIGMEQEVVNQLFSGQKEYSANGTANEKGSGLGLLLCREFLEACDGKIWAESEVGRGSRFVFELPRNKAYQPERPQRSNPLTSRLSL